MLCAVSMLADASTHFVVVVVVGGGVTYYGRYRLCARVILKNVV